MRKFKLIKILAISLAMSMMLSGCGIFSFIPRVKNVSENADTNSADADYSNANTDVADSGNANSDAVNSGNVNSDDTNSGDVDSDNTDTDSTDASTSAIDYESEYIAFLNGDRDDTVSFREYTDELCRQTAEEWYMDNADPKSMSYSIIDCGNDGALELAVLYEQLGSDEGLDRNFIAIFKLFDNDIKNIFCHDFGYRSYASLNQYGIFNYGGSNGATSHSSMYYFINPEGENIFLYGVDFEFSAYSLYIPDNLEYMDVAEEEGISESIEIDQYYFEEYDESLDYTDYVKKCDYVIVPYDDEFNPLEGAALDEAFATGAYDRFWDSTGLRPYLTQDEIAQKVKKKMADSGVTDAILEGPETVWEEFE